MGGIPTNYHGEVLTLKDGNPDSLVPGLMAVDYVSRCMVQEMREGRGCGPNKDHLHIHFSHLDPTMLKERLPEAFEQGRTFANVDILKAPIPIVPTVHYCMGGIPRRIA
jgi:succinate dehydrogenase / fumarate reductase flavoprotein subunit